MEVMVEKYVLIRLMLILFLEKLKMVVYSELRMEVVPGARLLMELIPEKTLPG